VNGPFKTVTLLFGILAVVFVAMWGIAFCRTGFYGYGHGMTDFMPVSGMLVAALVLVAVGLGVWWILSTLFWHKYFPTQSPPRPPAPMPWEAEKDTSADVAGKDELERRLDALERALLEGRISEETYRELKEKYEKRLKADF